MKIKTNNLLLYRRQNRRQVGFFLQRGKEVNFHYWIKGYRYSYSTNVKINRSDWDLKTQRPKQKKIYNKITDKLNDYQKAFNQLKDQYGNTLTNEIVRSKFDEWFKKITPKKSDTVLQCFELFKQEKLKLGSVGAKSIYKYESIIKKVFQFKKNLSSFSQMDSDFYIDFISYLRKTHNISDNTLHRNLGFLKTFLNWSVKRGYCQNLEYKEHTIKKRETSHVSLTQEELKLLEEIKLPERLEFYKDVFLIGIYSGQRYSDYCKFTRAHLKGDHLEIRQKKTNHICKVPLHSKLKNLLEKYNYDYPKISSQKFNENIQEICKVAGIDSPIIKDLFYGSEKRTKTIPKWKMIGSHTARRSFVTISTQKGMSPFDIMRVTGIREIKTLQGYIKDDDQSLKNSVNKIWS